MTSLLTRRMLAAFAGLAMAGCAQATVFHRQLVGLSVVDRETGQVLPAWRANGRTFIAGEPGARYGLRVTNYTAGRVKVVLSVDGVNIITGASAGYDQRGYIIAPHASEDLNGWRKSDQEIAAFTFAPLTDSYAARTGRPQDVGVIGMAVFTERAPPPRAPLYETPSAAKPAAPRLQLGPMAGFSAPSPPPPPPPPALMPAPGVMGGHPPAAEADAAGSGAYAQRSEKLGTGHGAREWSYSPTVWFQCATPYPVQIGRIEYDTYENLIAAGVIPRRPGPQPRPFPVEPGREGYVPDPPE